MVKHSLACTWEYRPRKQLMIPTELPDYPWQKIETDLFYFRRNLSSCVRLLFEIPEGTKTLRHELSCSHWSIEDHILACRNSQKLLSAIFVHNTSHLSSHSSQRHMILTIHWVLLFMHRAMYKQKGPSRHWTKCKRCPKIYQWLCLHTVLFHFHCAIFHLRIANGKTINCPPASLLWKIN